MNFKGFFGKRLREADDDEKKNRLEEQATLAEKRSFAVEATVAEPGQAPPGRIDREPPGIWKVGDVIADLYEVNSILGSGGYGTVYKVRHRGWNIDLAVKSLREDIVANSRAVERLIHEAETWVDLGLHRHVVSCHYVRVLDGIPRLFAEYVEGGSLEEWIESRKLYQGGKERALGRMLDIAIQSAWGLGYAHGRGLVHQDVKPANVMMAGDGTAKVTDFGLARSQEAGASQGQNVLASYGGMTLAYCSPEQMEAATQAQAGVPAEQRTKLTQRTDIWSWGVSVLEMFAGGIRWMVGVVAGESLESYLSTGPDDPSIPAMPDDVAVLLRRCFEKDPEARPKDTGEIADTLRQIFVRVLGQPYPREAPEPAKALADNLNNRALSMLDLGEQETAHSLWEEALRVDPFHLYSNYNYGLARWRAGQVTDYHLLKRLKELTAQSPQEWHVHYCLALIHQERGDALGVSEEMDRAKSEASDLALLDALPPPTATRCCRRRLLRHPEGVHVQRVRISGDGQHAIAAGKDYSEDRWSIGLWRLPDCPQSMADQEAEDDPVAALEPVCTLEGETGDITALTMADGGRWVLTGHKDGDIRIWDLQARTCVQTIRAHDGEVIVLKLLPSSSRLLSGGEDKLVKLWDTPSGQCLRVFQGHEEPISDIAVRRDDQYAVSIDRLGGTARFWDLGTGTCVHDVESEMCCQQVVAADGHSTLGMFDQTLWIFDAWGGNVEATIPLDFDGQDIVVSADGNWAVSSDQDSGTLCWWDLRARRCRRTFVGSRKDFVWDLAISPDGRYVLLAKAAETEEESGDDLLDEAGDERLVLWRFAEGVPAPMLLAVPVPTPVLAERNVERKQLLEEARSLFARGEMPAGGTVLRRACSVPGYEQDEEALDLMARFGKRITPLGLAQSQSTEMDRSFTVAAAGSQGTLLLGSDTGSICVWDPEEKEATVLAESHQGAVTGLCVSTDGRHGISWAKDNTLCHWDFANRERIRAMQPANAAIQCLAYSPCQEMVLAGGTDGRLLLLHIPTGEAIRTIKGHAGKVNCVAVSPTGCLALSGGKDRTVRLWDLARSQQLFATPPQDREVLWVAFDDKGSLAFTATERTLCCWNIESGVLLRSYPIDHGLLKKVALVPGGRFLIYVGYRFADSGGDYLKFVEIDTGKTVLEPSIPSGYDLGDIFVTANGRHLLSISTSALTKVKNLLSRWTINWQYDFPPAAERDEGASRYLEVFLALHSKFGSPSRRKVEGLIRRGPAVWTEEDFQKLLIDLGYRGYGWLRPQGVRDKLREMADHL